MLRSGDFDLGNTRPKSVEAKPCFILLLFVWQLVMASIAVTESAVVPYLNLMKVLDELSNFLKHQEQGKDLELYYMLCNLDRLSV